MLFIFYANRTSVVKTRRSARLQIARVFLSRALVGRVLLELEALHYFVVRYACASEQTSSLVRFANHVHAFLLEPLLSVAEVRLRRFHFGRINPFLLVCVREINSLLLLRELLR